MRLAGTVTAMTGPSVTVSICAASHCTKATSRSKVRQPALHHATTRRRSAAIQRIPLPLRYVVSTYRMKKDALTQQTARACVENALQAGIVCGSLVIADSAGKAREYGEAAHDSQRVTTLTVKDDAFWTQMYLSHGLGCE